MGRLLKAPSEFALVRALTFADLESFYRTDPISMHATCKAAKEIQHVRFPTRKNDCKGQTRSAWRHVADRRIRFFPAWFRRSILPLVSVVLAETCLGRNRAGSCTLGVPWFHWRNPDRHRLYADPREKQQAGKARHQPTFPKGGRLKMRVRIRMSRQTRIRLRGGRELASMVARRNAVVNTAMTARDVSNSAYKLAYGRNPPSIRRLLLRRSRRHPPGCMCPFHGGHR